MPFDLTILGSASASLTTHKHHSAQVLQMQGRTFLIDCGESTQLQLIRYHIRSHKISHIFISHLHGDHFLGLPGLLSSMHLQGRKQALHIYGPPALKQFLDLYFECSDTQLQYTLHFHETQATQAEYLIDEEDIKVKSFPLQHRIPTTGFLFSEIRNYRRINEEACQALGVPIAFYPQLKRGVDFPKLDGSTVSNAELTFDPSPGLSYAYCSDTAYFEPILEHIAGCELLYHEATFMDNKADRAMETFHSTTIQAATIAAKAGVKQLLIGHFSSRYDDYLPLLEETRSIFENTALAEEGRRFSIR